MRVDELGRLKTGMSLADVQASAGIAGGPVTEQVGARTLDVLRLPEHGVKIFFKDGAVDTIAFEAPFPGAVRGVRIGAGKDAVERLLGRPDRRSPIPDGVERWLYDADFLRVDFDPETDTVRRIFR